MRILLWIIGIFVLMIGLVIVPDLIQQTRLERALRSTQPGMTFAQALKRLPGSYGGTVSAYVDEAHPCLNPPPEVKTEAKVAEASSAPEAQATVPGPEHVKTFEESCPGETKPESLMFSSEGDGKYSLRQFSSASADIKVEEFSSREEVASAVKRHLGSVRDWRLSGTYTGMTPQHRSFAIRFKPDGTVRTVSCVKTWD